MRNSLKIISIYAILVISIITLPIFQYNYLTLKKGYLRLYLFCYKDEIYACSVLAQIGINVIEVLSQI